MISKARLKLLEDKLWERWISIYPYMETLNPFTNKPQIKFISFEEYKNRLLKPGPKKIKNKKRDKKEILTDVENILKSFRKK